MARFPSQNLASFGTPQQAGNGDGKRRFCYGKQRNVIIVGGKKMLDDGLCLRLLPTYATDQSGQRIVGADGKPALTQFREDAGFGDWCRTYECVSWFGQPGLHFIVWDGNPAVNRYESPVWLLYRAAYKNKETPGIGALFCDLLNRAAGFQQQTHVGSLKRPEQILFVSATQLYNKPDRTPGFGCFDLADQKENNARIFGFKKTAAESLLNALQVQGADGQFLAGDMLSAGPSKLVTVISKSYGVAAHPKPPRPLAISNEGPDYLYVPPYAISAANQAEAVVVGKPNPSPDGKMSGEQHWVVLHDTYNGQAVPFGAYANKIATANSTFDELMYVPSFEEQAELMAESFPREALDFAWRDHPEYIRYLRRGTTTVEAPQARFQPPTGVASSVATAHAINAATTTTTAPAISSIVPDADDIDPDAEAALAQLQMGMKSAAAASAPFGNKPQTADIVAEARAKAQAALQAARRNG
jgi:hypothetical protein